MKNLMKALALVLLAMTGIVNKTHADQAGGDGREKIVAALKTAREELLNGVYVEEQKKVLGDLYIAEQMERTASQGLDQARALVEKKIITPLQLEAATQQVQNAKLKLETAKANLNSLREAKAQVLQQFDRLEHLIRELKAK